MINNKKYLLKERLAKKFDIHYGDFDKSPDQLEEDEINDIVHEITSLKKKLTLEPFEDQVIPLGKNGDKTRDLFHRRKYYRDYALPDTTKNLNELDGASADDTTNFQGERNAIVSSFNTIDLISHKSFYGRIDTNNRSIYPSEKFLKMVDTEKTVMLVNFVADATNDMMEKIARMVQVGKIKSNSAYAQFEPKKGWTSLTGTHHKSMKRIFDLFISKYATSKQFFTKIVDFNSYITHFTNFLDLFLPVYPITRSNMQLAGNISPSISGLVFEIELDLHDNDEKKYKKYILDPHFEDIAIIANGFGFMIDKNAPWRFIADLESPQMQQRMKDLGFNTLQDMFSTYYYDTHLYEINTIRDYFLSFYDSYVEAYPYYSKADACGEGGKSILHQRQKRNKNPFTDAKLLEVYLYIRAKEANKEWNQASFDKCLNETVSVFDTYGFVHALHYINDKTTNILGKGANPGMKTKKEENYRIYSSRQSYSKSTYTIKL